jgi:hypothetical protein
MRALTLVTLVLCSGCFKAWDVGGPWACTDGGCADGFTCDDQVCCKPGGSPACPTLPEPDGTCRNRSDKVTFYRDADQDRAGDPKVKRDFCSAPLRESWVATPNDCDDSTSAIGPLASERCNAKDDDCDGEVDEGLVRQPWFRDADHDGFGADCTNCFLACTQPDGYAARGGDCDDVHPDVYPGAPERCNDVDDNCNGRKDDPPFIDVETQGVPGPKFECDAGLPGDCHQGSMQCVWSPTAERFFATCVAPLPTTDVCGDGHDNDCSGVADDRPGCGGPATLEPTLAYGAVVFGADAGLPTLPALAPRCLKNHSGGQLMAWLNPSWIANGVGLHVWYAEAAPGLWWDLSTATSIRLPFVLSAVGNSTTNTQVWDTPGHFVSPVIQLCGDDDTVFQRYTPTLAQSALFQSGVTRTLTIPLRPVAADGWTALNSNFNLAHVRRIEILASPDPIPSVTFTNRFVTTGGAVLFE